MREKTDSLLHLIPDVNSKDYTVTIDTENGTFPIAKSTSEFHSEVDPDEYLSSKSILFYL